MDLLHRDEEQAAREYDAQLRSGNHKLTPEQIRPIVEAYREQMKLIQALASLPPEDALGSLAGQAFRPVADYSQVTAVVAGYQLWDRIAAHPAACDSSPSINQRRSRRSRRMGAGESGAFCSSRSCGRRCRSSDPASQARIIRILGWQGDRESLPLLRKLQESNPQNKVLIAWAIEKIEVLRFQPWTN